MPRAKRTRSQAGKLAKNKGAGGERAVAAFLAQHGFPNAQRAASAGQAASGGNNPDVIGVDFYWVESKRLKRIVAADFMSQAEQAMKEELVRADGGAYLCPVVMMRQDDGPLLVMMRAEDWCWLNSQARKANEGDAKHNANQEDERPGDVYSGGNDADGLEPGTDSPGLLERAGLQGQPGNLAGNAGATGERRTGRPLQSTPDQRACRRCGFQLSVVGSCLACAIRHRTPNHLLPADRDAA